MHQIEFRLGLYVRPQRGSSQRFPRPSGLILRVLLVRGEGKDIKGREGRVKKREGRGGKGKGYGNRLRLFSIHISGYTTE